MMKSEDILEGLMAWVEIDTPTGDVIGIGKLVDLIQSQQIGTPASGRFCRR